MDLLKAQLARLREQLNGLSVSQKMLAGSLVVIMAMTLVWWGRYAAEPEMQPVLNVSLAPDNIAQITSQLDAKGIPYRVEGDKVVVPADRKMEALADLSFAQVLPRNFSGAFDDIVKQMSPFDSQTKTDALYNEAKQRTLSQIISGFPGVAVAQVMIDPKSERRLDNTSVHPSSSVIITTRADAKVSPKQLAEAAADVVAGAEAGLSRGWVNILIDGKPFNVQDRGDDATMSNDTIVDNLRQHENFYRDKIRHQFEFIDNLFVSVTVNLNTASTVTQETVVDPKNVVHTEARVHEHTEETTAPPAAGEPGAVPNTGVSLPAASGTGASSTTTDNDTTFNTVHGHKEMTVRQGPGDAQVVAASVRVPRSYFVNSYKSIKGQDPDEAALKAYTETELAQIKADVKACTGMKTDDAITVGLYSDALPGVIPVAPQALASPVAVLMGGHVKEIGAAALAVVSLFMVMMMVRKGTPAAPLPVPPPERPDPGYIGGDPELAGEVGEGTAMLDGMELGEDEVKTQQMLDQVQQMVGANPDAAAQLVKRWLNRS